MTDIDKYKGKIRLIYPKMMELSPVARQYNDGENIWDIWEVTDKWMEGDDNKDKLEATVSLLITHFESLEKNLKNLINKLSQQYL